jgi:hypothetical protein
MNRFLSKKNNNNNNKKNIEKMDFPELGLSKKKPIVEKETSYINIINKETVVKKNYLPEGYIVLKEGIKYYKKEKEIDENILFYNSIISTQKYLDRVHEKYRENFIELHGEDLYDKYYTMTDSHIYIEEEPVEEEEEDIDEE